MRCFARLAAVGMIWGCDSLRVRFQREGKPREFRCDFP
jgi:hypothetical protein